MAAAAQQLGSAKSEISLSFNGSVLREMAKPLSGFGISPLSTLYASVTTSRRAATSGAAASPQPPATSSGTVTSGTLGGGDVMSAAHVEHEQEECVICLECYTPEAPPFTLACRHAFHGVCISSWSQTSGVCPLCRRPLQALQTAPPMTAPPPAYGAVGYGPPGVIVGGHTTMVVPAALAATGTLALARAASVTPRYALMLQYGRQPVQKHIW